MVEKNEGPFIEDAQMLIWTELDVHKVMIKYI